MPEILIYYGSPIDIVPLCTIDINPLYVRDIIPLLSTTVDIDPP